MKKITYTLFIMLLGIVFITVHSCNKEQAINTSIKKSEVNSKTNFLEKYKLNQITRVEYLQMGKQEKEEFENLYKQSYGEGGSCECASTSDPGCSCDITCNPGTIPNCQCSIDGCTCTCVLYSRYALQMVYDIVKNDDETVTLTPHIYTEVLGNYLDSDFPNTDEVEIIFNELEEFGGAQIVMSLSSYQMFESKMQDYVGQYSINELFAVAFLF